MATVQSVLDLARIDLNDINTASPRYPDTDLLTFFNNGVALCYSLRPDLKFGSYSTVYVDLAATSSFPLPLEYRAAVAAYIVARNQAGDDEFVLSQRADRAMAEYVKGIGL